MACELRSGYMNMNHSYQTSSIEVKKKGRCKSEEDISENCFCTAGGRHGVCTRWL